jgi:hypothetical protein
MHTCSNKPIFTSRRFIRQCSFNTETCLAIPKHPKVHHARRSSNQISLRLPGRQSLIQTTTWCLGLSRTRCVSFLNSRLQRIASSRLADRRANDHPQPVLRGAGECEHVWTTQESQRSEQEAVQFHESSNVRPPPPQKRVRCGGRRRCAGVLSPVYLFPR